MVSNDRPSLAGRNWPLISRGVNGTLSVLMARERAGVGGKPEDLARFWSFYAFDLYGLSP